MYIFGYYLDPVIFEIGPVSVKWYGVTYIIGFIFAWMLGVYRAKLNDAWNSEQVTELIYFSAWGVILGGRLGYWLFYDIGKFIHAPLEVLKIWNGGMSFHGGLIGVLISLYFFQKKYNKPYHNVIDFVAPLVPLAIGFGRIGNFINGELWGRVTDVSWAVVFPDGGPVLRHPSQLYEACSEGLILFIILWVYSRKPRAPWNVSGIFLIGYGLARFCMEYFREPDFHLGFVLFGWMTQGQLLTLPMIFVGIIALNYSKLKEIMVKKKYLLSKKQENS